LLILLVQCDCKTEDENRRENQRVWELVINHGL